jgi:hypothetical protein
MIKNNSAKINRSGNFFQADNNQNRPIRRAEHTNLALTPSPSLKKDSNHCGAI